MKALINAPICPLMTRPSRQCELGDEALFGMAVEVLEETLPGWYRVRTPYRYEDYAPADCLLFGEHNVQRWLSLPKRVVCSFSRENAQCLHTRCPYYPLRPE